MAIKKTEQLKLKALSAAASVDLRKAYKLQRAYTVLKKPKLIEPLFRIWDRKVHTDGRNIHARVYNPKKLKRKEVFLFFHGGGWVTESVYTYDRVCYNLAKHLDARVISVEYRLAPENPFPDGLDDCYAVTHALFENAKDEGVAPEDIVLIGDSAGGNYAAVISMLMRDIGEFRVSRQILFYPAVNSDYSENSPFESVRTNGTDYLLTSKHMEEYIDLYVKDKENLKSKYVAPILAEDFSDMPKTLIITAQYDPLRDEGEYYGKLLARAGNTVKFYRMADALHGFFSLDPSRREVRRSYRLIRKFLDEV